VRNTKPTEKLKKGEIKISKKIGKFFDVHKKFEIKLNRRKVKMFLQKLKGKFLEAKLPKKAFQRLKGMKRVKNLFLNKIVLRKAFAAITIFAVIVTAYFQNVPNSQAATFTL
jgi:hypothetical protein